MHDLNGLILCSNKYLEAVVPIIFVFDAFPDTAIGNFTVYFLSILKLSKLSFCSKHTSCWRFSVMQCQFQTLDMFSTSIFQALYIIICICNRPEFYAKQWKIAFFIITRISVITPGQLKVKENRQLLLLLFPSSYPYW